MTAVPIPPNDDERLAALQGELREREAEVAGLGARREATVARLRTLARVNHLVSSSLDMSDVLREIASAAVRLMEAPFASFWLADEASQTLELGAWAGDPTITEAPLRTVKFGEGIVGSVARGRCPLQVSDASQRFVAREWAEVHGLRSVLAIPVIGEGALLAVLAIIARAPISMGAEDQNLVEIFAGQAAAAIRNARIFAESESRRRAAEALADVGAVLAQTLDPEVVGQRVADRLRALLGADSAALFRLEPGTGNLVTMALSGATDGGWSPNQVFPRGNGATGLAIEERRPVVSPNVLTDPRLVLSEEFRARIEASQHRAVLAVPLVIKDRAIGALSIGDRAGRLFRAEDVQLAQACADQAALALEGARLFQDAQDRRRVIQALYDLTVAMERTMDVRERVEIFIEKAREALDFDRIGVFVASPDIHELEMIAGTDLDPGSVPPVAFWERGGGFQAVWESGQTVVVSTDAELAALPPAPPEVREHPFSRSRRFVIVPLRFQGRPIGVVGADNKKTRRPFSQRAVAQLELFSQQLAVSLNTARVFAESEGRRRAAEALADVGAVLAQTLDPEVVAQRIADDVRVLLAASSSAVYRLEPESGNLVAVAVSGSVGPTFGRNVVFPRGTGVAALAVREGKPVVTPDILNDPRIVLTPEVRSRVEQAEYRAVLALPLTVKDRAIGALGVGDRAGRRFRADEIGLAQALAHQAALALQSARLYAETQRREREATVLFEVVRRLSTTLDLEQVLDIIADHTLQMLPCDATGIFRWDEARGGLALVRGRNMNPDVSRDLLLKPGEGVGGRAYADRRPVWSNDRLTDQALLYSAATTATLRHGWTHRASLAVPIVVRKTVFGVLMALHTDPQQYSAREIDLLSNLAVQGAVAIENASLYAAEGAARAVAEAATGAKSRFLASMSHELRTPLNSVIGFANVLLKNKAENLREQDLLYLRRILDNGTHLLGLINDILDLSKIEAGRIELTVAPVALDGLVHETIRELESQVRDRDLRLVAELPPSMAPIHTDRSRLKQVLINLIGNALKFTERGRVTVRVAVESRGLRPVCIEVIDTGIGIPREKQALIFEAFQQSDLSTTRRYGGTGLGLAISRSLAQQMGYQLGVESEVGRGSTFRISLTPARA